MDLLDAHRLAGDHVLHTTGAVPDDAWDRRSTCDEWTVAGLVAHLVGGCWMAVALIDGATAEEAAATAAAPPSGSRPAALVEAVVRERAALSAARLDELVVHHPVVDMTGCQLLETRIIELTVHGWDLARSVGVVAELDARIAEVAWSAMAPLTGITAMLGVFGSGPSGTLPDDASAAARLLDATGRRP